MSILGTHKPTLRLDTTRDIKSAWILEFVTPGATYQLHIDHDAQEDVFTYWKWEDGDLIELISMLSLKDQIETIMTYEGWTSETAREWILNAQPDIHRTRELMRPAIVEMFDDLKRYWTALTVLVNPEVTL